MAKWNNELKFNTWTFQKEITYSLLLANNSSGKYGPPLMKLLQCATVWKPLSMWGFKDLFYDQLSNSIFSLCLVEDRKNDLSSQRILFTNKVIGLAMLLYWNSQAIMSWLSSHTAKRILRDWFECFWSLWN